MAGENLLGRRLVAAVRGRRRVPRRAGAGCGEDAQGIGRAAAPAEGQHQLPGELVVQRLRFGPVGQAGQQAGVPPGGQRDVVAVEFGGEPLAVEHLADLGQPGGVEGAERLAGTTGRAPARTGRTSRRRPRQHARGPRTGGSGAGRTPSGSVSRTYPEAAQRWLGLSTSRRSGGAGRGAASAPRARCGWMLPDPRPAAVPPAPAARRPPAARPARIAGARDPRRCAGRRRAPRCLPYDARTSTT